MNFGKTWALKVQPSYQPIIVQYSRFKIKKIQLLPLPPWCADSGHSGGPWRTLSGYIRALWSATPRCWHHIKTPSPVVDLWTGHPSVAACNCWWSLILLLLAPGSGTLCLRTLHLRLLYWCSDENWRRIYFGNLIRTLYCSLCGMLRPVVLKVIT